MKSVVLCAAVLLATPAGAVTYEYVGEPLFCDEAVSGICFFGPTLPGFSGFTFDATPPEATYRYSIGYYQQVYRIDDNGVVDDIYCYSGPLACDEVRPPDWLSGEDIDPFFDGHTNSGFDYMTDLDLAWVGGRLSEWTVFEGANGCADNTDMLITNIAFQNCAATDRFGDQFSGIYLADAPGEWIATPAPIPLPAAGWLLLGALAGGAMLRRGRPRAA